MLARIVWIVVVALNLAMFASSIPAFIAILHSGCMTALCHAFIPPYSVKQIQAAGFSFNFYLTYLLLFYFRACWQVCWCHRCIATGEFPLK